METNNIVICQINSKYIHSSLAPWCLLSGIKEYSKACVNVCVIEGTVNEEADKIAERIIKQKPICVGFCTYIWNYNTVKYVAGEIKSKLPCCKIVLGGPQVSYSQREVLEKLEFVDYISSGEGELPFAKLVDFISGIGGISELEALGISYRLDNNIIISKPYLPDSIPPSPYTDEYFKQLNGRIAYFETSRGCPFSCAFCLSGSCGKLRFYPEERVKSELIKLGQGKSKTIKLVDRTFNADRRRADRIFEFIRDSYGTLIPNGTRIHCEIAAKLIDRQSLEVIKSLPYGAVQFEVGIQSFNQKTLKAICRDTDIEKVEAITKELISLGNVHIHTDLIAGLPFEDYESFKESFNKSYAMKPHMLQLGFLKILPGSKMGEADYEYKCEHMQSPPFEVISTEYISKDELQRLHKIEEILERTYNSGRFHNTLEYVMSALSITPFDLFERLSECIEIQSGMKLDHFTQKLMEALEGFDGVESDRLFDAVLTDRISTNPDGRLPKFLKYNSCGTSLFKKQLLKEVPELFESGVRHCFALLKSEKAGIYAKYDSQPDCITGKYEVFKTKLKF